MAGEWIGAGREGNDLEIERLGSSAHLLFLAETGGDRLLEGETGFVGQRPDLLFLGAL